eukprot:CAMPEP_0195299068 /NCGR_PEP_ID=MMETSP0707-20130614/24797_1 /TAXON_ID=33640 /ORGANISM="Asterionellopsis glacialis, Strain CCMP134" /LENGTH=59 /DNA_ID=CAMNT_0040361341 /DNA_START=25 /DNA_END=201 /DNA_ORIENTATION=+
MTPKDHISDDGFVVVFSADFFSINASGGEYAGVRPTGAGTTTLPSSSKTWAVPKSISFT